MVRYHERRTCRSPPPLLAAGAADDVICTLVRQAATHTIKEENNTDQTGDHVTFLLQMEGSAPPNIAVKPGGEQAITVTVSRLDDHDLETRISGAAESVRIEGTISLHRDAVPTRITTGTYTNCDNTLYDKMYGAQNRSPSECEAKFHTDVRHAIHQSLARAMGALRGAEWIVEKEPWLKPIRARARSTEKNPFRIDFAGGGYEVVLKLNSTSRRCRR